VCNSLISRRNPTNIRDLKPGMSRVDLDVKVAEVSEPREIVAGGGRRRIRELRVEDETGSMTLVLWDEKSLQNVRVGDHLRIRNGFVTSYKGDWRINVGRYGEVIRNP